MPTALQLTFTPATDRDVGAVVRLRTAVAERLTELFGSGHWSLPGTENGVRLDLRRRGLFVASDGQRVVATLHLAATKPWAIDAAYFTAAPAPLYLTNMAVQPELQRTGIGRWCLDEAVRIARDWRAGAIRLDAYDAAAGAGGFYARCGFREVGRIVYRAVPLVYYERLV
jgi:GNAT superfamily N-acetyltransferase